MKQNNDKTLLPNKPNQQSNKKGKYYSGNDNSHIHTIYLLPILFVIAILPFIIHIKEYTTTLSQYPWFTENSSYVDFFLYYRQWVFVGLAVLMVLIILFKSYINKQFVKFTPVFIPLVAYALLAFLSSIISEYRNYSFAGTFDQFESIFAILGYCLIVYYVFLFVNTEQDIKLIINCMLVSILVLGIIGIAQVLGHDFISSNIGKRFITSRQYWDILDTITFNTSQVYLTLYNPNYVGVYVSLVLPILLILLYFNKKLWLLPLYLLALAGLIISLIGSKSTTGLVGIFSALLLSFIFLWRYWIKYFYITVPIILLAVFSLFIFNKSHDNFFVNQLNKITNIQKSVRTLSEIQTNDDELVIKYNGNTLRTNFLIDNSNNCFFIFMDDNDEVIPVTFDNINGPITIQDERFPGFVFTPSLYNDVLAFNVLIDGQEWYFTNQTEDNSYYYINNYGRLDKIITAPSAIFTGYEEYASGRGYIWSRTIPLLKNNIILGSGADTFVLEFPQHDYINLNNYGFGGQLLTKPHSLYLQIGVQTGVLSLLAFLIFYGMYFISSVRLYIRGHLTNYYSIVGLAILIGTFSYMIVGITNDSTITVAPVFWALLGLGLASNKMAKSTIEKAR